MLRPTGKLLAPFLALLALGDLPGKVAAQPNQLPPAKDGAPEAQPIIFEQVWTPPRGRLGVSHQTGEGVGYKTSFTTFDGWLPLFQEDWSTWFITGSGLLFNDSVLGGSLGLGYRWVNADQNRLYGANGFYDYRDTGRASFHQLGAGIEVLGQRGDARANVYLPCDHGKRLVSDVTTSTSSSSESCTPVGYQGHNLLLKVVREDLAIQQRLRQFETAMCGFDAEVGPRLAALPENVRPFLGMYHYQADEVPQVWGVKGRLEYVVTEGLALNLTVNHDRLFDTSVVFNAVLTLPGPRSHGTGRAFAFNRLEDPVERARTIVVTTLQSLETSIRRNFSDSVEVAKDAATGNPFIFQHADSNAAAGGDGTFEKPYQSLAALAAGSSAGDILLVHAGSDFTRESITLQDNQRLLGDSDHCQHFVDALHCGNVLLPRANALSAHPIIDSVILANNNEVAGFDIDNGILGTGITDFNINCNHIFNSTDIDLFDVAGIGRIFNNTIEGNFGSEAIRVGNGTSTKVLNLTIADNKIFTTDSQAIDIDIGGSGTLNLSITNNIIDDHTDQAIFLFASNTSKTTAIIAGNTITNVTNDGIQFGITDAAEVTARISGNTIGTAGNEVFGHGVLINNNSTSNNVVFGVLSNTMTLDGANFGANINSSAGTFGLRFLSNSSNRDYSLNQTNPGVFNAEAVFLMQTLGVVNTSGTINTIPAGSLSVP